MILLLYLSLTTHAELVPIGEQQLRAISTWEFDLNFTPGTRRITGGRYLVRWPDGSQQHIHGRSLGTLWYAGLGYNHDRWHHGLDHGGLLVERESWRTDRVDLSRPDRQFLASVMEFTDGGGRVIGFGHTEQLLIGEYQPLGWGPDYGVTAANDTKGGG